jgi:hypothetical protein
MRQESCFYKSQNHLIAFSVLTTSLSLSLLISLIQVFSLLHRFVFLLLLLLHIIFMCIFIFLNSILIKPVFIHIRPIKILNNHFALEHHFTCWRFFRFTVSSHWTMQIEESVGEFLDMLFLCRCFFTTIIIVFLFIYLFSSPTTMQWWCVFFFGRRKFFTIISKIDGCFFD